jgi:hypothetical protein
MMRGSTITISVRTLTWSVVVAASLLLIAGAVRWWGTAQAAAPKLTADDRTEILNLYAAYTRYFDFADVDPHEMVKKVWTPDAVFVNVTPIPASGKCPDKTDLPPGEFRPASPDLMKGSLADKLGIKAFCVATVKGYEDLALRAVRNQKNRGTVWRTRRSTPYIEATPEGAHGFVTANYWAWDSSGGKWYSGGTYEEDYVRTANGWRLKKRVFTGDEVVGKWRPAGAPPATE